MRVNKGRIIRDYFEQTRQQFTVPVYQRNYDWGSTQCKKLFEDIVDSQRRNTTHYVGSIVTAMGTYTDYVQKFFIIDGQQRLTTTYILLKALYDMAEDRRDKEDLEELLFNKVRDENLSSDIANKLKLKSDNEQIKLLMENKFAQMDKSSNVYCNYQLFKELIQSELSNNKMFIKDIYLGIDKLECASITLDESDRPQEVFESINSTGLSLSIADLIRNYILMIEEDQVRLYENYWVAIENNVKTNNMTAFIIDYLNFKSDGFVKESDAYTSFKTLFKRKGYTNESMLEELAHYSKFYHYFIDGDKNLNFGINTYLDGLKQLKQTTAYGFLFRIFDDYEQGLVDANGLEKILKFLFNYSVRRIICEIGSNTLRGLFKTLYSRIFNRQENYEHYVDSVLSFFQQLNTKDKVPTDAQFMEALKLNDLYHKNSVCKFVLSSLENQKTKEPIQIKTLTIEHIMPQNDDLSKEWRNMLGENWRDIHTKYLNTLGNLTLTGYNSELSDKPFEVKKEMVLQNSKVKNLNKDVLDKDKWNEDTIVARADRLSKEVCSLFNIEVPEVEISYKDTSYQEYKIDNAQDAYYKAPNYYIFQGEKVEVNDFMDIMTSIMKKLYDMNNTILETIARENRKVISWSSRVYISYDKDLIKYPEQLEDTGIYYDTNLSAPKKIDLIKGLFDEYDIDYSDLIYSAKSSKKSNDKVEE